MGMNATVKENFILQQGFAQPAGAEVPRRYNALLWQPRIVGAAVLIGTIFQSKWVFVVLAAVLWWSALVPSLNPFDLAYDVLWAGRGGRPRLAPAPAPRRFSQGMAGSFALAIAASLQAGLRMPAYVLEAMFLAAAASVALGGFCLGSFIYHLVRGRAGFATSTLPWARAQRS